MLPEQNQALVSIEAVSTREAFEVLLFGRNLHPRGGTCENFDRDARVIFLGLKLTKTSFFWVSLSCRLFLGVEKIAVIFLGSLKICVIFWVTELCI